MNRTTAIVGGIVVLIALGGLFVYANQGGFSPQGVATTTPDTTGVPGANTAGTASAVTSSNVTTTDATAIVTGSIVPNGALTSYWYEYGLTAALGAKTAAQIVGSGYSSFSAPGYIVGLSRDTTYYFRLVAENQYGRTYGAAHTLLTTHSTPAPQGGVPTSTTVSADGITKTAVNLHGQVIPNGASTQFWFEYGTTVALGNTTSLQSVGSGTAVVPAATSLSGLQPLTTYYFRLNAQNQFGTVNGGTLSFTTAGPAATPAPAVQTSNATAVGNTSATLRGSINPQGEQTTYWFEYSTDSLLGAVLLKTTPQASAGSGTAARSLSANVTGLARNTTYYARIVAQNSKGQFRGDNVTFKTK
ncbi:MAG: hypothetical protein NT019_01915 [Candidatus Adlerbacteria bacterium]|nr:hypothetical protein [Candidatus Adlerbacteria bacterium]